MTPSIEIDGDDIIEGLHEFVTSFEAEAVRAMRSASDAVAEEAHRRAPEATGDLKRSIDVVPTRVSSTGLEGGVVARAPHAASVEDGSVPHVIRATRAHMLRFTAGGQLRFARSVNHPGTRPQPFLGPALEAKGAEVEALFAHAADRALRRAGF